MEGETKVKYFKQCMWIATCVTVRNKTVTQDLEKAKAILQVMEWDCLHLDEQLQEEFTDSYSAQEDKSLLEDSRALLSEIIRFMRHRSLTVKG